VYEERNKIYARDMYGTLFPHDDRLEEHLEKVKELIANVNPEEKTFIKELLASKDDLERSIRCVATLRKYLSE